MIERFFEIKKFSFHGNVTSHLQIEQTHDRLEIKIGLSNETIIDHRNIGGLFLIAF